MSDLNRRHFLAAASLGTGLALQSRPGSAIASWWETDILAALGLLCIGVRRRPVTKSAATKSAHRQTALLVAPFESLLAPCVGCQDHQRRGTRQIRRLALT